jgi:hypothetical protein
VDQPVTDCLGCRATELADAAEGLGPGEQVVGGEAELHSGVVVDEVVEGQVGEPGCFGVADHVLGSGRARWRCRSSSAAMS